MWEENVIKYFKRDRQIAPHLRDFVTPLALGGMPVAGTTLAVRDGVEVDGEREYQRVC